MPIFTCLIAFPVEKQVPKPLEIVALTVLSVGIMTCVWRSNAAGTIPAMLLCLLATICNSAMSCFAGKIMSEALDALQVVYFTAPISLIALLPFLLYKEVRNSC
jgi:drug/metabolite transporter (DMT)-like permease